MKMVGHRISHYQIEKRLGAGGMGEVYLATDQALGRKVALKVLPSGFPDNLRVRLLKEAQVGAQLQHPGIATFYEAGDSEGTAFIAMEYVKGDTLRQRLRSGPLPFKQSIALIECVLEALGHAHAAGVLHRDIKPENIIINGERSAKLLDFGLAKSIPSLDRTSAPTVSLLTVPGTIMGTLGYMSPEQLSGQEVDQRSDLFSVGVVLYEALSGHPAFNGTTPAQVLTAIISREAPSLAGAGIPPELNAVLSRALGRDRCDRYSSSAEFLSDLRRLGSGDSVAALPDTLAVVDLRNLTRNPEDDWIGSGIAESLATDLLKLPGLSVVGRDRVLKIRAALEMAATAWEARDLGLALGCRWVLSGSFQKMGPALRVTMRLTEVATGREISAEKLDGTAQGIFEMQDRLSAAVVEGLRLRLPAAVTTNAQAPNLEAYELYARGRRAWFRYEKGGFEQAAEFYERAVDADPAYAPALSGLAGIHALRFTFTTDSCDLERAAGYAQRAIDSDPKLCEPHIWLGYVRLRQRRTDEVLAEENTAASLDRSAVFAPYFAGCALAFDDRRAEALPFFQRSLEIDAQHGWSWLGLGWCHLDLGHTAEASWSLGKAVELEKRQVRSPTAGVSGYLGECLRRMGDVNKARVRCLEGLEAVEKSDHMYRDTFRCVCLCALGRTALQQGDPPAARAAFVQAVSHLHGRPRALGGGQLMVQALAGLARAGDSPRSFQEARRLFELREGFDFSSMWSCSDDVSLLELARAARTLGQTDDARVLLAQARQAGSREALQEEGLS
jgi:TolB-like protein/predicted Ser/Thr protein kinase